MKRIVLSLFLLALAVPAFAAESGPVYSFGIGAQGVWFQGDLNLPSDFELGANGAASLSPHISAVGAIYFGLQESYLRGSFGARFTVTDVDDKDFSIGVGAQYRASSEPDKRPDKEVCPDVSLAWKPSPENMPRVLIALQAAYGLKSNQAELTAGVRYAIPVGGGK